MLDNPKVSVIIPVYNVEKYLEKCVESVCCQTLKDIEIILIDDESPDSCPKICEDLKEKDSRIKVIHKKNGGLGYARNTGLDIAKGTYISFVDSDDYIEPDMLEKLYEYAVKEDADYAFAGYRRFFGGKTISVHQMVEKLEIWRGQDEIKEYLMDLLAMPPSCEKDSRFEAVICKGILKKSTIDKNMIRFVSEREIISEDIIWDIDFFSKSECIVALPDIYYNYRYNPKSLTMNYKKNRFDENKKLYFEIEKRIKGLYSKEEYEKRLPRYFLATVRIAIFQEGDFFRENGITNMQHMMKKIVNDELVEKTLELYPYHMMCKKYAILFKLIHEKKYRMLCLMSILFSWYRKMKRSN